MDAGKNSNDISNKVGGIPLRNLHREKFDINAHSYELMEKLSKRFSNFWLLFMVRFLGGENIKI